MIRRIDGTDPSPTEFDVEGGPEGHPRTAPRNARPIRELFRQRPELVVGPALGFWILANCLPITFGKPFVLSFVQTALGHGNAGQAFPITYACAVFLVLFAFALHREWSWPRRVLVSIAVPFAFIQLYEIPYDLLGHLVWPVDYAWAVWPLVLFLNASWLVLGLSTVPFWRLRWKGALALSAFLGMFLAWWAWFFPPLGSISPPLNPEGSGYIVSKVLLAALIAILLWDGRDPRGAPAPGERSKSRWRSMAQRMGVVSLREPK
jgi:hypothetical protein